MARKYFVTWLDAGDDVSVENLHPMLREFYVKLCKDLPGIKLSTTSTLPDREGLTDVRVYYEGDPVSRGKITWEQPSDTYRPGAENKICVWSDSITNKKFGNNSYRQHMLATKNMDVAVRHARKHLRRPDTNMIAEWMFSQGRVPIAKAYIDVRKERDDLVRKLTGYYNWSDTPLLRELLNIHKFGTFHDKELGAHVAHLATLVKETDRLSEGSGLWSVVFSRNNSRGQPVVAAVDITTSGEPSSWRAEVKDTHSWHPSETPEDVQGKVAVLSMVDNGHYVEGVGVRIKDGCCLVSRETGNDERV